MRITCTLLLCALSAAGIDAAAAQAPPVAATPPAATAPPGPQAASDCAPTKPVPSRGTVVPEGTTTGQASEPLGDRLAKSNGVLCPPPGIDPEMRAPAPDAGNTPVIPPPGSPGGDPNLRPK
ncbi:hypothetical protein [Bradyrhizobium sp. NP1]|uniref:hypothetical protein n=1 Tax=Bradyrhizobium sp. NP1 TaxID=3049772 RepID=UPI0025A53F3F|nr:hypothetical protein [Bradyrhizobium sp. NP1]WJR79747.1 hypothetical protein QOU61_08255 [Bradyrhizobium sp. NP1]